MTCADRIFGKRSVAPDTTVPPETALSWLATHSVTGPASP